MQAWHVLYTKPHCEFRVSSALETRGITSYLPALPAIHPRAGRAPLRAFFPCYLFAHFDMKQVGESAIAYLPGLRHIVMTGNTPATIPSGLVDHISHRLAHVASLDARGEVLAPGDRVEVLQSGFEEFDVVFDAALSPAGRVRILVRYLERQYPAYKNIEHIKPVEIGVELLRKKPLPAHH